MMATTQPDSTTFRCLECGSMGTYDSTNGWYLVEWYAALKWFDDLHRDCAEPADARGETEA